MAIPFYSFRWESLHIRESCAQEKEGRAQQNTTIPFSPIASHEAHETKENHSGSSCTSLYCKYE